MSKGIHSLLCLLLTFCFGWSSASAQPVHPKRELRAVWFASVSNIDFPSAPGKTTDALRREWTGSLDVLADAGFNAVAVQVRPAADALYASKLVPWSRYLTGRQGLADFDSFDPLRMMVAEAHDRTFEFHAWLNPYRAAMDTLLAALSPQHPLRMHPEWMVQYGGRLYLNPALPEVRNYITEVVMELILNYDIDGIHFDDYFYPYPAGGEAFPDAQDFVKFGFGFQSIEAWRRSNVDKLIAQVSTLIRHATPQVQFGVSPFGVWRNQASSPNTGSATRSAVTAYDDLYADVLLWLEKGWVDYVAPQLYWNIGYEPADYKELLAWWHQFRQNRPVWPGLAAYKVGKNPDPAWQSAGAITEQIRLNRTMPGVQGAFFYNAKSLLANPLGLLDSLRNGLFAQPALPPELPWMGLPDPPVPQLSKGKMKKGVLQIPCNLGEQADLARYLVVYRFNDRLPGDFNNPENIYRIVHVKGRASLIIEDEQLTPGQHYTYAVSSLSPQHTESTLSNFLTVQLDGKKLRTQLYTRN